MDGSANEWSRLSFWVSDKVVTESPVSESHQDGYKPNIAEVISDSISRLNGNRDPDAPRCRDSQDVGHRKRCPPYPPDGLRAYGKTGLLARSSLVSLRRWKGRQPLGARRRRVFGGTTPSPLTGQQ
jgi:hypothetical protein